MNVLINISEIAIITGDNTFKTRREFFIDFWRKNAKADYQKYSSMTEFVKETDMDVIQKIAKANNIDLNTDLENCAMSRNTTDLNSLKNEILKKIDKLDSVKKAEISASIKNVTNTKFGIKNEYDVAILYNKLTGLTIVKDNKYRKIELARCDDIIFLLGGKIDGICAENGCIIEIKNRVNRIFYELRGYEKVQIMCYLFLHSAERGQLVEALKKKDGTDINVIDIEYDHIYMNGIKEKLIKFIAFFVKFMTSEKMKMDILQKNDEINFY
jgi:hypothetical protein